MEVMRNILLVISVLGIFVFGYFLMTHLDKFIDENRKDIEKENEKKEPSCIMLTEEMSEEEIAEEVRRFREKHESTLIVLYERSDTGLPEILDYHTDRRQ